MNFLQLFTKGLPNTLLVNAGVAFLGFFSGVVLAHTLLPASRGEFAAIMLWPNVLVLFGELGLGFAFSFYVGQKKTQIDVLWTTACGVSLVWGGLLAIFGIFFIPTIVHLSPMAHFCLIWNLVTVPFSLLLGYSTFFLLGSNRIFQFNMVRLLTAAVYSFGIVFVFLTQRVSLAKYTIVYILSQSIGCVIVVWLVLKYFKPKWHWQPDLMKGVFLYGGKNYLSSLAAQMNLRLDQLFMSSLVVFEQLGFYVVAVSFSAMLMPLFDSLAIVTLPRVTLAQDLNAKVKQAIRYFQLGLVIGIPAMIFTIIIAPWFLPFLFSVKYTHSVFLSQILLIGVIFQGSNIVLGNALRGLGYPGKTAIAEGTGLIVTIILLLWFLPIYGALGAALTSLSAYSIVTFMQLFFVKRIADLEWRDFYRVT
jgi:O-antigen/teichoic acid export membrane protein